MSTKLLLPVPVIVLLEYSQHLDSSLANFEIVSLVTRGFITTLHYTYHQHKL